MVPGSTESTAFHVELGVESARISDCREMSAVQVLRGLHRPVLPHPSSPAYSICVAGSGNDEDNLFLSIRDDARWDDGVKITALDVRQGILRGFVRHPGLMRLLGINPSCIVCLNDSRLFIRSRGHQHLVATALRDFRFAPERVHGGRVFFSGAFRSDGQGSVRLLRRTDGLNLRVNAETNAELTLKDFDSGRILFTCPTSFELAARCGTHASFRPCMPDIQAYVIVHPGRAGTFSSSESRRLMSMTLEYPADVAPLIIPMPLAGLSERQPSRVCPSQSLHLLFSDYYPNASIAASISRAASKLGLAHVEIHPLPLQDLVRRIDRADFDLALVLTPGMFGPTRSYGISVSALAMLGCNPSEHPLITSLFDDVFASNTTRQSQDDLIAILHEFVPLIPIGRFASGYLAQPNVPRVPLIQDAFYPIEILANGPAEEQISF